MNINCPDCNTVVSIDETMYHNGDTAKAFCPRCGATVSAVITHGGQDLPIKRDVQFQEAEVVQGSSGTMHPSQADIEIKKAELALKAKELELKQRELEHNVRQQQNAQTQAPTQVVEHVHHYVQQPYVPEASKSKSTAGILGILLGGIGAHHFYLGNTGRGVLYLIFCWTYIPALIGLIEGISYLCKSDAEFAAKYPK